VKDLLCKPVTNCLFSHTLSEAWGSDHDCSVERLAPSAAGRRSARGARAGRAGGAAGRAGAGAGRGAAGAAARAGAATIGVG
jgi:hypothetical protein